MNIFIEGLPGMGKSTLLQKLSQIYPDYHVYREGDYCPAELAWCSYMTAGEYTSAVKKYPSLEDEIKKKTFREKNQYIVEYTRIITDEPGFHNYMGQYEIYQRRKSAADLEHIILQRYGNLPAGNEGNFFECAFLQNIMEELILFQQMSDDQIFSFYRRLFFKVNKQEFRLFYLYSENIEEAVTQICRERCDVDGNPLWYPLMMDCIKNSPYGISHNLKDFSDMIEHFKHRMRLEMKIIKEILPDYVVILPAKKYMDGDLKI